MKRKYLIVAVLAILVIIIVWGGMWLINSTTPEAPSDSTPDVPVESIPNPEITIDSVLDNFVQDAEGCIILSYVYTISYSGTTPVEQVVATSRFTNFYSGKFVITNFVNPAGDLVLNPNFDGVNDINLFEGEAVFPPDFQSRIEVGAKLCGYQADVDFVNYVDITGVAQEADNGGGGGETPTTPPPPSEPPATTPPTTTPDPGPVPTPVPTPPPEPPADLYGELLVSTNPDRSGSVPADGYSAATGVGLYVWLDSNTFAPVEFYINGEYIRTENYAAWDLMGTTTNGNAVRWLPRPGVYVIEVRYGRRSTFATITITEALVEEPLRVYDYDQVTFSLAVGGASEEEAIQPPVIYNTGGGKDSN